MGANQLELVDRRFTLEEYDRMVEVGILYSGEHVELLGGRIVHTASRSPRYAAAVSSLAEYVIVALPDENIVYSQSPLAIPPDSEPEPALLVLQHIPDRYRSRHPRPADVLLLVEVADVSFDIARLVKLPLYAAADIPETWIFDLNADRALMHREPRNGVYTSVTTVERGGMLSPLAFPELALPLNEILRLPATLA